MVKRSYDTAIVFLLGYTGVGKRTVGGALAELLDGVLLDDARIHGVLLEPFRWDGVAPLGATAVSAGSGSSSCRRKSRDNPQPLPVRGKRERRFSSDMDSAVPDYRHPSPRAAESNKVCCRRPQQVLALPAASSPPSDGW